MEKWHFFAAFLVSVLLLAGGLNLTAQSIQELRGERVTLDLVPGEAGRLAGRVLDTVRDSVRYLLASTTGERIALRCRDGIEGIKGISVKLHELAERMWIRFGSFVRWPDGFTRMFFGSMWPVRESYCPGVWLVDRPRVGSGPVIRALVSWCGLTGQNS